MLLALMHRLTALAALCALASTLGAQVTRQVPLEHPDIQSAINAASDGDLILVTHDVQGEIDFLGKAITIRGAGDDGTEIVDIDVVQSSFGVRFVNGEGPNSVLENFFFITSDALDFTPVTGVPHPEPAIYCAASPTIRNCVFHCNRRIGGGAAAICVPDANTSTSPRFQNCEFYCCVSDYNPPGAFGFHEQHPGGAVRIGAGLHAVEATFEDCVFGGNYVNSSGIGEGGHGGAIYASRYLGWNPILGGPVTDLDPARLFCRRCQFINNHGGESDAGSYFQDCDGGSGGAICVEQLGTIVAPFELVLDECEFHGNRAGIGTSRGGDGGAVALYGPRISADIQRCRFSQNQVSGVGGTPGLGGAVAFRPVHTAGATSELRVRDCLFSHNFNLPGNHLASRGGAIAISTEQSSWPYSGNTAPAEVAVQIESSTFFANLSGAAFLASTTAGDGIFVENVGASAPITIRNCLFDAHLNDDLFFGPQAPTVEIDHCLSPNALPGTNNLLATPIHADAANGDLRPGPGSPTRDAGLAGAHLGPRDQAGLPRLAGDGVDIGCFESGPHPDRPGSGEDFVLALTGGTSVASSAYDLRHASERDLDLGESLTLELTSPNHGLVGAPVFLFAQGRLGGLTGPSANPAFPEIWISVAPTVGWDAPILVASAGALPAPGLFVTVAAPAIPQGITVRFQGLVLTTSARNGLFTTSSAPEVHLSAAP